MFQGVRSFPSEAPIGMAQPGGPPAAGLLPQAAPGAELPVPAENVPVLNRQQVEQIVSEYLRTHPGGPPPVPDGGYEVGSDGTLGSFFQTGLRFESPNKDFRVHVGGMFQFDGSYYSADPQIGAPRFFGGTGPIDDAVDFRRARLHVDGTMYEFIDWVAEYDFANTVNVRSYPGNPPGMPPTASVPGFTDVYARMTQLPIVGNFTAGNFKEPIGFEHLVNDNFLSFMERSYNMDVFYGPYNNGFNPGVMLSDWAANERGTWALWAGPNQNNTFGYHVGNAYAVTGRLTYLPVYDGDGRYLLHIGGSASSRAPDQGQFSARARGQIFSGPPGPLNPIYATTGSLAANSQSLVNLELAGVWGPLTVQAEYSGEWVSGVSPLSGNPFLVPVQQANIQGGTAYFQGGYVEALWFLTGENRIYNRRAAVFDRVIPNENFYLVRNPGGAPCFGRGAWQVGVRYSGLDLNSVGINGGKLNSLTLGLNWYLNPNMKVQWNYDFTHRTQVGYVGAGNINSFGMRLALDF